MYLLREIEKFMKTHDIPWTKFGRLSVKDPRFVGDLRNGREAGKKTIARVQQFMKSYGEQHEK